MTFTRTEDLKFRSVPCAHVKNVQASIDYYIDKLGFKQDWVHNNEDGSPYIAGLHRDDIEIFVQQQNETRNFGVRLFIELAPTNLLTPLFEEFQARGATIVKAPTMQSWGWTVMTVTDLDGNVLLFCGDEIEELKPGKA